MCGYVVSGLMLTQPVGFIHRVAVAHLMQAPLGGLTGRLRLTMVMFGRLPFVNPGDVPCMQREVTTRALMAMATEMDKRAARAPGAGAGADERPPEQVLQQYCNV